MTGNDFETWLNTLLISERELAEIKELNEDELASLRAVFVASGLDPDAMATAARAQLEKRMDFTEQLSAQQMVLEGRRVVGRAHEQHQFPPSKSYARPFYAHLNCMAQRITDLFNVFLFGVNGNTARADDGRRSASHFPGVTWVQDGIELAIAAGIDSERRLEVELFLGSASGREPHAIFWADPKTLSGDNIVVDLFDIHRSGDGRYLVAIKKPELERRLAAISKERNEGQTDKAIAFSPLVEFG